MINRSTSVLVGLMHCSSVNRSRRVLTMEWIEGVKLTNERGLRGYGIRAVDFVDLGVDCTMRQLLEHGKSHTVFFAIYQYSSLNHVLTFKGRSIELVRTATTRRRGYEHGQILEVLLMLSAIYANDACVSRRLYRFSSRWPVCIFSYVAWFEINPGYFHADPHPGNILATRAGELVYLDFGMMSEAPLSARLLATLSFLCCSLQS